MIHVDHKKISSVMINVLLEQGLNYRSASSMVSSLIQTSLRGVDSHGINLFPHYYKELQLNRINKNPNIKINKTSSTTCIIDADNSFGHHAGDDAVDSVIEMCANNGMACVSVKNSNHFAAAAYFTNRIAKHGMFGFAFTNSEAFVNAHNTKELFLGTNPFCFSSPMYGEEPFCLDMATSTVSWNKIKNYRRWGKELESGWALDKNGNQTEDSNAAASLTSIGDYKGFGLGMVIEILCAGLTLGPISKDIRPLYDLSVEGDRMISHFFMAIDVSKFAPIDVVSKYIKSIAERVRSLNSIHSSEISMIAGDKEKMFFKKRLITGIPIDDEKMNEFCMIDSSFGTTTL